MTYKDFTTSQLETIAFEHNYTLEKSEAFELTLCFVKQHDEDRYKYLLYKEIEAMDRVDELECLKYDEDDKL
jgi:hypothetical protein